MDNSSGVPTILYVLLVFWLLGAIFGLVCSVVVLRKAGYSGWMVLLGLVPIVNIVWFLIFVFGEWPIQRELALLRVQLAAQYGHQRSGYGYPPSGYGSSYGSAPSGYGSPYGPAPSGGSPYGSAPSGYGYPQVGYGDPPYGGPSHGRPQPEPPTE